MTSNIKTISINNLTQEGMTADLRDTTTGVVKLTKHFDILTQPKSLRPYRSQVTGDGSASTNQIADFLYYNSIVYGRGVVSGTARAKVFTKSDFSSSTWGNQANSSASTGSAVEGVFVEYHAGAYGFNSDGTVWKNDLGGAAWVDSTAGGAVGTGASKGSCAGLVHSKDDVLYMATGNIVAANNAGTWNRTALTLPSRYTVTSLCEYGDFLAIACKPLYAGRSVVFLWDRDSTLNTISEVIDFGTGNLQIIEQVEGEIIGISSRLEVDASSARLVFRRYSGGTADVFRELLGSTNVGLQLIYGKKQNERLYFLAGLTIEGVLHNGVWAVGKNAEGRWIVWFDRLPNNDTAIGGTSLVGFLNLGDFMFVSYDDGGYALTQTTNNIALYTGSSLIETVINPSVPLEDRTSNKQLLVVAPSYSPLTSGQQVISKYKVDGGSWQTVFTETTVGRVVTETGVDATSTNFTSGREYQFRFESTGGAIITGLKYKYEVLQTTI